MDLIFYLTRSAPAADSVFPEVTLVPIFDRRGPYRLKSSDCFMKVQTTDKRRIFIFNSIYKEPTFLSGRGYNMGVICNLNKQNKN
jgi:hypothetical protein